MADKTNVLLAHIISQTRQNITFLVSQDQISAGDAQQILAKLPPPPDQSDSKTRKLVLTPPHSTAALPSTTSSDIQPSVQARALWGYNEAGQEAQDLSFRAGDIIEVISEMNPDWWTGRFNGHEGLFPSNHVAKLTKPSALSTLPPPSAAPPAHKSKEPQPPSYQPPPYGGFISPPPPPPPQQNHGYLFRNASYAGPPPSQTWYSGSPPYMGSPPVVYNPNAGPPSHRPDQPAFLRPGFG